MKNLILACILLVVVTACKKEKLSDLMSEGIANNTVLISSQTWRISSLGKAGYFQTELANNDLSDFFKDGVVMHTNADPSSGFSDRFKIDGDAILFEKLGSKDGTYTPDELSFEWEIVRLNKVDFWIKRPIDPTDWPIEYYEIRFRAK